jgi:hypothetical protein
MKNQGDHRKDEEEMNQESGDMVEEEAADPNAEEYDGQGEPKETAHGELLILMKMNMDLFGVGCKWRGIEDVARYRASGTPNFFVCAAPSTGVLG